MMNIDVEHGTIEKVLPDFEVKKTSFRFGFPKNSQKILPKFKMFYNSQYLPRNFLRNGEL